MSNITRQIHILMAEDENIDRLFAQKAFADTKYSITLDIVEDGEEAILFLNQKNGYKSKKLPDIIMLDINMPRKNGHETLKAIKADERLKHIPVIMFSGSNAQEDILRSYRNYANAYLPKPSDIVGHSEFVKSIENFWFDHVALPKNA